MLTDNDNKEYINMNLNLSMDNKTAEILPFLLFASQLQSQKQNTSIITKEEKENKYIYYKKNKKKKKCKKKFNIK